MSDRDRTAQFSALAVFRIFLRLGLTSFGGPVAHIGYFRQEFVARRQWLNESAFAALVTGSGPAHRRHGGAGALYVYLRRTR